MLYDANLHEDTETRKHLWAVRDEKTWQFCSLGGWPRGINLVTCQSPQHTPRPLASALLSPSRWAGRLAVPVRLTASIQMEWGGGASLETSACFLLHKTPQAATNQRQFFPLAFIIHRRSVLLPQPHPPPSLNEFLNSRRVDRSLHFVIFALCTFLKCLFNWENWWLKTEIGRCDLETTENLKVEESSTENLPITGHTTTMPSHGLLKTTWVLGRGAGGKMLIFMKMLSSKCLMAKPSGTWDLGLSEQSKIIDFFFTCELIHQRAQVNNGQNCLEL